jgi:antitoxin YefM
MNTYSITSLRENLYEIAKEIILSRESVMVTSKKGPLVLLAKEDYEALMETVYLHSIPGLSKDAEKLKKAAKKDLVTRDKLPW